MPLDERSDPRFSAIEKEVGKEWIGLKMICTDDSFSAEQIAMCDALPVRGQVYTIRRIRVGFQKARERHEPAILFEEIVNRLVFGKEPGFWASRFEYCGSDEE